MKRRVECTRVGEQLAKKMNKQEGGVGYMCVSWGRWCDSGMPEVK